MKYSSSNIKALMMACLLGVCVLVPGSHGAPGAKGVKRRFKKDVCLRLNTSLPDTPHIRAVSNSSVSPWEWSFSHDENRIPSHIAEARCMYTGCLTQDMEENLELLSKPIHHQILVLRKVPDEKEGYALKLEYKTIAVGCTCVKPHVLSHNL
ncbi:interleukin 17a/f1 [Engraulis encrasicolus]|uniref:interleukin 17a/f1 n=1 Tax=Engraulis encrasicolus TaxID=184585 RepID=UPI002FD7390B